MDLHQLRTFVSVAESGHLTRTAERLHLSQPTLSAHIRALEEEFGVQLFERSASGMEITRPGRDLLRYAERVLAAAEELRRTAQHLRGRVTGHVRIGTVIEPQLLRLGTFLGRAVERFPALEIEVHQAVSVEALASIRDGTLDASFYFGDLDDDEIAGTRLADVDLVVVAPAAWAERLRDADWGALSRMPWVLAPAKSSIARMVREMFAQHGLEPLKHVEADNEQVMANLVASGVGVALMRKELALDRERAGAFVRWPKAQPRATLWFIHRADRARDPEIVALLEVLRETWAEAGSARKGPRAATA